MKKLVALLWLAASCAEAPKQTDLARKTFEGWAKAAASGDAEKTLAMFSDAKKSDWLFERLEENDVIARRWRGELTGRPRTDLDLWWGMARKRGTGRTEPVSSSVLDHPTFVRMFREYFLLTASTIKRSLENVEITQVYGDDTGITVAVRSGPGMPTEMYGLIYERDGWKIDLYKPALGR